MIIASTFWYIITTAKPCNLVWIPNWNREIETLIKIQKIHFLEITWKFDHSFFISYLYLKREKNIFSLFLNRDMKNALKNCPISVYFPNKHWMLNAYGRKIIIILLTCNEIWRRILRNDWFFLPILKIANIFFPEKSLAKLLIIF